MRVRKNPVATTAIHSRVGVAIRLAISAGFAGSVLSVPAAMAAVPTPAGDALDEVVVTAQFREQNLQNTPLSITAVSGEMLEARSNSSIADVANQAPNVSLKPQGQAYGPAMGASIRGIGQYDFNPALEPGVGIYVDDVYYATLTGSVLDLLDLDRVEILRGPQGTLAGRNSIGGAVKLYSRKPSGGNDGYLSATYGSRNRMDLRGSADLAITDTLFAHLSGVSKHQNGYISRIDYACKNPGSGLPIISPVSGNCVLGTEGDVNYDALRLALRWKPTEDLEIGGAVDYTNDDRSPAGAVMVQGSTAIKANIQPVQGSPATYLPLSAFQVPAGSYYNYATFYNPAGVFSRTAGTPPVTTTTPELETRPDIRSKFKGWGVAGNVDWKLGNSLSLKSITAYRQYDSYFANDNDLSPLANSLGFGTLTFHSFSEELRLNGALFANDALEYTLGAFYMNQKSIYATTQDLRYSATGLTQFNGDDPVNADSKAAFGQVSYKATDKLTLNGGLRYTSEHKDYTFSRRTYTGALHPSLGVLDGKTSNYDGHKLDYRLNLQYQWTDALMSYLQVATGFKGGGISPRPFSPAQAVPFDPEELKSYEAGLKSDFFDRKLRLNGSVFFSKYTNMQLGISTCPAIWAPVSPCAVLTNAGDAEMRGAELEAVIRPVQGFSIDASASYLKFKYTSFNPAAGGPTTPSGPQFGMYPVYTPKIKWSAGAQYEIGLGDAGTLTPRLDASYQGEIWTGGNNSATNRIAPYALANARLTWRNMARDWEIATEVTNLTDKYYFLTRFDQFTTTGVTDGQPGRPREYAVTIKKKF